MRTRFKWSLCSLLAVGPLALGCGGGSDPDGGPTGSATGPTFHRDVEPILQKSCQNCHSEGHIAPFSLMTYDDARSVAGLMVKQTQARKMPPFAAQDTAECQPRFGWREDLRLSQEELDTISAWHEAGDPEGDPADAPPPYTPPAPGLSGADLELTPVAPFISSGTEDQFRCFMLDPALTQTRYINGMAVVPGNPAIVHHALTFVSKRDTILPLVDGDGGYECFGGPPGALVHAWAPGAVPLELDDGVGAPIGPDDVLVMQIHYHPAGAAAAPDSTTFQARFASAAPVYTFHVGLIGNFNTEAKGLLPGPNDGGAPEFRIPAGAPDHIEAMRYTVPTLGVDHVKMYMVATHMHYVGRDMKVEVTRPSPTNGDPAEECVLQTPDWAFDWQRFYGIDAPLESLPRLRSGDVIDFRCVYDNTLDNPYVVRALSEQNLTDPQDVFLGETTLDEMCLFAVGYLVAN